MEQLFAPTATLETITPEIAKVYFAGNKINRSLNSAEIEKLKNDILKDRWEITDQGISFDTDGRLLNGQTRLLAIIAANKPVQCWVMRGLKTSAMQVIDSGRSRSMSDRIKISEIGDERIAFKNTTIQSLINKIFTFLYPGNTRKKISIGESTEIFDRYKTTFEVINNLLNKGHGNKKLAIRNRPFAYAALSALCHGVSEDALLSFVNVVVKKEVEPALRMGYNYKAALQYDVEYAALNGYTTGGKSNKKEELAVRSIYCFVNNKKSTRNSDPYPMTIQRLDMLETRLRRWSSEVIQ